LVEVYVSNSSHSLPVFQVKLAAHDPYDEYIYMTYILGGQTYGVLEFKMILYPFRESVCLK